MEENSLSSCSFLRTPGVLAATSLLLALRHLDADSLVSEWRDSASMAAPPGVRLRLTSPREALSSTAGSGVGRARRLGGRALGVAAGGERGGDGGREGLVRRGDPTRDGSRTLKDFESQESLT